MSDSKSISPSELASVIGVSRQTVYNRMTKDLSKFVKEVDGKKRLDIAVLEYLGVKQNVKEPSAELDSIVKALTALTKELEVKNEQIKALTQQNAELTAALQTTTQSLLAAQALHASSVQQLSDGSTHQGDTKKHWWNSFHRHKSKK